MRTDAEIDTDRIDDALVALLWLTVQDGRAWKGHKWDALGRLHDNGLIGDPVGKQKSVRLSEDGLKRSEALYHALFARKR